MESGGGIDAGKLKYMPPDGKWRGHKRKKNGACAHFKIIEYNIAICVKQRAIFVKKNFGKDDLL